MKDWKKIYEVEELVQLLNIANAEVNEEVLRAREQLKNMKNPIIAASAAVNKMLEPYQSADGMWHCYEPSTKQWKTSKEDPHKALERKRSGSLVASPAGKAHGAGVVPNLAPVSLPVPTLGAPSETVPAAKPVAEEEKKTESIVPPDKKEAEVPMTEEEKKVQVCARQTKPGIEVDRGTEEGEAEALPGEQEEEMVQRQVQLQHLRDRPSP